jgi:tail lysozyme
MPNSTEKVELARLALDFFVKNGWSKEQAAGLVANIEAESEFNPRAVGDAGAAFGICQWHADRQADYRNAFGSSIRDADYAAQLRFVTFELINGEKHAGDVLRGVDTAERAGEVVCTLYERPNDPDGHVRRSRGARAQDWFQRL